MATAPASVHNHPVHAILVAFPIGPWMFSLVYDLMYRFGGEAIWSVMAWYTMIAGVIGAAVAAIPGLIDFFSITAPRVGCIGLAHLIVNAGLVSLFSANAWIRTLVEPGSLLTLLLSIVGVAALVVSGWLGGEMVYVHRVGISQTEGEASATRSKRAA
jgi:uncharacterized membrane protein